MTENQEPPLEEPRSVGLGYATARPTGPSVWNVFGGLIFFLLGLASLALGVMFTCMAVVILTASTSAEKTDLPAHSIGPALVAVFCYFAAVVLFKTSRRLFSANTNARRDK
jgi:hypothetical protein